MQDLKLQLKTLHQINYNIALEQDNALNSCVEVTSVMLTREQTLPSCNVTALRADNVQKTMHLLHMQKGYHFNEICDK